jgi:hypothetical protein
MNIQEIRQKYPQYNDMSDSDLATALHAKHYSDVPFTEFSSKIGLEGIPQAKPMGADIPRGGLTEAGHTAVRRGLPVLGASALTLAAPQAGIPTLMGLAGLGAASGEGAGQLYDVARGKQPLSTTEALKGMGKEAAIGAAAEGAIGGGLKLGKHLFKPKSAQGARVLKLAKEADLPVSRAAIDPKRATSLFNAAADLTPGGRIVGDYYRKQLVEKTSKYADDFTGALNLAKTGKEDVALGIGKKLDEMQDFTTAYKGWNDLIEKAAKEQHGEVLLEDSYDLLNDGVAKRFQAYGGNKAKAVKDVIEGYGFKINSKEGLILKRIIEDEVATPKDLKHILSKVWKDYGKQADIAIQRRQALKNVLIDDVGRTGGKTNIGEMAAEAKASGDAIFKEVNEFLKKSPHVKAMTQKAYSAPGLKLYEAKPEMVMNKLMREGTPDELAALKTELAKMPSTEGTMSGKEAWNGFKFQYVNDLVEQAITTSPKTGERVFLPAKFSDLVEQKADVLQSVFPDIAEKVQDFAAMSKGIAPGFESAGQDIVQRMAIPTAIAGGALKMGADPTATTVVNGFGALVSYGMLSNAGKKALSKWILQPAGKVFKEGARAGLMLGGEELTF